MVTRRLLMSGLAGCAALLALAGCSSESTEIAPTPSQTRLEVPTTAFEELAVETDLGPGEYVIVPTSYTSTGMECSVEGEVFIPLDSDREPTGVNLSLEGVRTQCYHPSYIPSVEVVYVTVDENGLAMLRP